MSTRTLRVLSFCVVVIVGYLLPFWAFAAAACVYAVLFGPYELLILAVIIDAQFGEFSRGAWYSYTLLCSVVLVVVTCARPYLRFYE